MRGILASLIALCLFSGLSHAADAKRELKIGMLSGMFRDVPPSMMHALAKPFRDLMQKQTGFTGDVQIFDDPIALADALAKDTVQLGVFHGFEYAWARESHEDFRPLIITQPPGGKVQGLLVVNKDNEASTLADLGQAAVAVPRGAKAHTLVYLEKQRKCQKCDIPEPDFQTDHTPEDVLNAVATGKSAACLVDVCALEGYRLLNPGQAKRLKTLGESEAFPPAVIAYRKNELTEEQVEILRTGLSTASKTPSGKMLMTLWSLKGFEVPKKDYETALDSIIKAYPAPSIATAPRSAIITGNPKKAKE